MRSCSPCCNRLDVVRSKRHGPCLERCFTWCQIGSLIYQGSVSRDFGVNRSLPAGGLSVVVRLLCGCILLAVLQSDQKRLTIHHRGWKHVVCADRAREDLSCSAERSGTALLTLFFDNELGSILASSLSRCLLNLSISTTTCHIL